LSLEFAVEHPCSLRARYDEKHLRAWGRLSNLHRRLTTGEAGPPTAEKVQFVENARDEVETLQVETNICSHCPACLPIEAAGDGEAVGCLGRVNYPIEAQFEKFLADRVQLMLDTLDIEDQPRLLRILVDAESPFDGEGAKELRRITTPDGLRFFELRLPIKLTRQGVNITSDHVFDLLAGFMSEDARRTTYAREFPYAATADYYDFLDHVLRNDMTASEVGRLNSRGRNYSQFLRLLAALERAEALNTRVLVD
jgi:hypothetical protein